MDSLSQYEIDDTAEHFLSQSLDERLSYPARQANAIIAIGMYLKILCDRGIGTDG